MVLECTMFCLDNSDYMRNGDHTPIRLSAQNDSVSALAKYKIDDNRESIVGFLTMAGSRVDVHMSPSRNIGKLLNGLKTIKPSGVSDILTALKIAQLTVRNRQNKAQRPRIVLFVGSPVTAEEKDLVTAGYTLKKNGVGLDIVLMGTENFQNDTKPRLTALLNAVDNGGNSHLIEIHPSNPARFSDIVLNSALGRDTQPPAGVAGQHAPVYEENESFGMDDIDALMESDPELAMALRMSLEEAGGGQPALQSINEDAQVSPVDAMGDADVDGDDDDDEAALLAAIELSRQLEEAEDNAQPSSETIPQGYQVLPEDDIEGNHVDDLSDLLDEVGGKQHDSGDADAAAGLDALLDSLDKQDDEKKK